MSDLETVLQLYDQDIKQKAIQGREILFWNKDDRPGKTARPARSALRAIKFDPSYESIIKKARQNIV